MKKALVVLAVLGAIALPASKAYARCGASVPMFHSLGSYFACNNSIGPVSAFSYLAVPFSTATPTNTNNGGEQIAVDVGGLGSGTVQISTDWGNELIAGCPQDTAGNHRVMIVVQANDGTGVLASISGASSILAVGYTIETAHLFNPDDPVTLSFPLQCGSQNGRPTVMGVTTTDVNINVLPPHIFSDCDPGTVGEALGDACVDGFGSTAAAATIGGIYTSTQPCGMKPVVRRDYKSGCTPTAADTCGGCIAGTNCLWTRSAAVPDPLGNATVPYTKPASGCVFIGTTTTVGGVEGGSINGFIQVAGALAASPKAENVRASSDKGKVTASWSTSNELGLAGFRTLTETKSRGQFEIGSFVAAKGSPSTYSVTLGMGDFKGGRTLIIRAVLADGTTVDAAPVNF